MALHRACSCLDARLNQMALEWRWEKSDIKYLPGLPSTNGIFFVARQARTLRDRVHLMQHPYDWGWIYILHIVVWAGPFFFFISRKVRPTHFVIWLLLQLILKCRERGSRAIFAATRGEACLCSTAAISFANSFSCLDFLDFILVIVEKISSVLNRKDGSGGI